MAEKHAQIVIYWTLVFIAACLVVLGYYRYQDETRFIEVGSRFTGEDAIWLLENSNIELKSRDIPGESTPFREYIR